MRIVLPGARRRVGLGFTFIATLAMATSRPATCRADLVIEAPAITAQPGTSGSFDVLIENTNLPGGAGYDVSSFTLDFAVTGPAGVTLDSASISTITTYLFVSPGVNQPMADPFVTSSTATSLVASDAEFNPPNFFRTINPGGIFGLAHVSYTIAAIAAIGDRTLHIGSLTLVSDVTGTTIPSTALDGVFRVRAVPEPSTLALLGIGGLTMLAGLRNRSRRDGGT